MKIIRRNVLEILVCKISHLSSTQNNKFRDFLILRIFLRSFLSITDILLKDKFIENLSVKRKKQKGVLHLLCWTKQSSQLKFLRYEIPGKINHDQVLQGSILTKIRNIIII